jgi:hypothetical protein
MKNSTIIAGASALVLAGVGAYLYFSGKKTTPPSSSTPPSSATPPIIGSNSAVNSSLGLPTTTTSSTDEQKNYLQAKDLARLLLLYNSKTLNDEFKLLATKYAFSRPTKTRTIVSYATIPVIVPKKINELGYKVLSGYDIEKM